MSSASHRETNSLRASLVGCGYWGRNLLRNMLELPGLELVVVCDVDPGRRSEVEKKQGIATAADFESEVLEREDIDAVVIATPAAAHAAQVRAALEAGKHVLVEKPLALTAAEAVALARLADERGLLLMAGHTFLFNAAVLHTRRLIESGELGDIYYLAAQRLSLGIVRSDVDALWNLAPHDISIANYLLAEAPAEVSASGSAFLQPEVCDVQFLHLRYASGRAAHVHVSWLHPRKVRQVAVVGSKKMLVFDDVAIDGKITVYDKGIDRESNERRALPGFSTFSEFQFIQRAGDVHMPYVPYPEPLGEELRHFIECWRNGAKPRADARSAVEVVATLEAASRSLAEGGRSVPVAIPEI